ncbi:MAG: ankyrin repeat domain-containing protein [Rickettsiaceae bacterium]|nr:MAG: ankyrin repeat domain-containing protein [Rickettsiaceae bacterium]
MIVEIQEILKLAIKNNDLQKVEILIKQNVCLAEYPYIISDKGRKQSIAHYAAEYATAEMIEILHKLNISFNILDEYQNTPLIFAAYGLPDNIDSFKAIINISHLAINSQDFNKYTALHLAVRHAPTEAEIAKFLEQYQTHPAVGAIQSLIAAGADVDMKDQDGNTPLHLTTKDCIVKKSNQVHNVKGLIYTKYLIIAGCKLDIQNAKGQTALHLATTIQDIEIMTLLIRAGAAQNIQNNDGQTPLDIAKRFKDQDAYIKNIVMLLEEPSKIDKIILSAFTDCNIIDGAFSSKEKVKIVNLDLLSELLIRQFTNYIPTKKQSSVLGFKVHASKSKKQVLEYIFNTVELSKEQSAELAFKVNNAKSKFFSDNTIVPTLKYLAMSTIYEEIIIPGLIESNSNESKTLANEHLRCLSYYFKDDFTAFADAKHLDMELIGEYKILDSNSYNICDKEAKS